MNEPGGVRRPAAASAEIADLGKTMALLSWDQQVMMPSGGAAIRAEQLATVGRIAHTKFISAEVGRLLDDLRDFGRAARVRLVRGEPDPRRRARLGEGEQGAGRPARGDVPLGIAREPGLGRRAPRQRLRVVPARASKEPRSAQALHRLLRGRRRAVRHRARRLRARHEDGGGAAHLRLPEGASGAARQGSRGAGRRSRSARRRSTSTRRRSSSSRSCASSASPPTRGVSTRPCIRSHQAPA